MGCATTHRFSANECVRLSLRSQILRNAWYTFLRISHTCCDPIKFDLQVFGEVSLCLHSLKADDQNFSLH